MLLAYRQVLVIGKTGATSLQTGACDLSIEILATFPSRMYRLGGKKHALTVLIIDSYLHVLTTDPDLCGQGDVVLRVDGVSVKGMSFSKLRKRLVGPQGSTVSLKVMDITRRRRRRRRRRRGLICH